MLKNIGNCKTFLYIKEMGEQLRVAITDFIEGLDLMNFRDNLIDRFVESLTSLEHVINLRILETEWHMTTERIMYRTLLKSSDVLYRLESTELTNDEIIHETVLTNKLYRYVSRIKQVMVFEILMAWEMLKHGWKLISNIDNKMLRENNV